MSDDLFSSAATESGAAQASAPLAVRMRPRSLGEFAGQGHLLGEGRLVRRLAEGKAPLPSLILWGPPGTGKTTLARLLASAGGARFVPLSAVLSGVKELREAIAGAREARRRGRRTRSSEPSWSVRLTHTHTHMVSSVAGTPIGRRGDLPAG